MLSGEETGPRVSHIHCDGAVLSEKIPWEVGFEGRTAEGGLALRIGSEIPISTNIAYICIFNR